MSLSAVPTAILLPPVSLLWPLIAGLLAPRRHRGAARIVAAASLALLVVLSLPVVAKLLLISLDVGPVASGVDPPAAIVILSGDAVLDGIAPDIGGLTLDRERTGARLYRQVGLPVLVTGGHLPGTTVALGALMADSLKTDFGVPVRWVEPMAQDTVQNARLSAAILHDAGIHSIFLVTHAWHMRRSMLAFDGTGIAVTPAPVPGATFGGMTMSVADFVPRTRAWQDSYYALHEWIGTLFAVLARRV